MKVSIITPTTKNRKIFMDGLALMVQSQTYPNTEWLIDESDSILGTKRNNLCNWSTGDLIVHFDSDDYYAPDYIEKCVAEIEAGADTTGLSSAYFANLKQKKAWIYQYKGKQPYVIGSGMMYKKSIWEKNKFRDINQGEDMYFLAGAGRVVPNGNINSFYATIHGNNTASHNSVKMFDSLDFSIFEQIFISCNK